MKSFIEKYFVQRDQAPLPFQFCGIVKYVPLIVCGGFFFSTIVLFSLGPLDWHISNPFQLYGFLALSCIALALGYVLAIRKAKTSDRKTGLNANTIFFICAAVFFIMYVPTLIATTGKWYPDIITGITNTGKAYRVSQYLIDHGSKLILYIRIIASPFMIMVPPLTLFFMPKLNRLNKVLGVLAIILTVFLSISKGVNKAVADFCAQILLVLLIWLFSNSYKRGRLRHVLKIASLILLVCLLFFSYFTVSMRSRVAMDVAYSTSQLNKIIEEEIITDRQPDTPGAQTDNNTTGDPEAAALDDTFSKVSEDELNDKIVLYSNFGSATVKEGYWPLDLVPERYRPTALYLSGYLSHGFKGLSVAMDQEFTSSYGLGFSDFFRRSVLRIFGRLDLENGIYERTYMAKTSQFDFMRGVSWSTFFVYPASDITFYGTILLAFVIGYLFALSWKDALVTHNPFAITVFYCFGMMVFYFSANNQMFEGGENFIGIVSMIAIWLISRRALFAKGKSPK